MTVWVVVVALIVGDYQFWIIPKNAKAYATEGLCQMDGISSSPIPLNAKCVALHVKETK